MTQGQSIVKGDTLQKTSSAGFVLGALLIAGSGLLMPHANAPTSDLQQMLRPLGEHEFLTAVTTLENLVPLEHATSETTSPWA